MRNHFNPQQLFFRTLVIGAGLLCAAGIAAASGAWVGPTAAPPGNNTASFWSLSGSNLYYNGGNVGIGTANPAAALDVAGTINATSVNATKAPHVQVVINVCTTAYHDGGNCDGTPAVGAWWNMGLNEPHTAKINTDPSTFTTNGSGVVTVNKAGTYFITIHEMSVPNTTTYGAYACPEINGAISCSSTVNETVFTYAPAGYWSAKDHQFIMELTAGTTVSYGMYWNAGGAYWGQDNSSGMDIVKLN